MDLDYHQIVTHKHMQKLQPVHEELHGETSVQGKTAASTCRTAWGDWCKRKKLQPVHAELHGETGVQEKLQQSMQNCMGRLVCKESIRVKPVGRRLGCCSEVMSKDPTRWREHGEWPLQMKK